MVLTNFSMDTNPVGSQANISMELTGEYNEANEIYKNLIEYKRGNIMLYDLLNNINKSKLYSEGKLDSKIEQNIDKQEEDNSLPEPLYGGAFYNVDDELVYISKILYNNPVTVVFWSDGTKTLSRCAEGDTYNPEVGLILAVLKKVTSGDFTAKLIRDWTPKDDNKVRTLREVRKEYNKK